MNASDPANEDQQGNSDVSREPSREISKQRSDWKHQLTPLKIGIGLGILIVAIALVLGPMSRDEKDSTTGGDQIEAATTLPATTGIIVPINDVDPVTGKPIGPSSPTLKYKGYNIAFCCEASSGYKGDWDQMSEAQKDAFVKRYLK